MKISLYLFTIILLKSAFSVPLEPTKSKTPQESFSIIDIPASVPEDDNEGNIKESSAPVPSDLAAPTKDDSLNPVKSEAESTELINEKEPNKPFGPTVLIIQRRPMFPFFTNPFNTRVSFPRPSIFGPSSSEELDDEVKVGMPPLNRDEDPFETVMTRLHSQFSSLFDGLLNPTNRRRPVEKDQSSDESNSESEVFRPRPPANRPSFFQPIFPSFNFPQFQFPKIPSSNFFPDVFKIQNDTDLTNSTTSETKTVDGHIVTVNKTQHVIRDKDNKTNGFFQFQVINVRPTTTKATTTPPKKEDEIPSTPEKEEEIPTPQKPVDYDEKKFAVEISDPSSNEVVDKKESKEKKDSLFSSRNGANSYKSPRSLSSDLRVNHYKLLESHEPYFAIDDDVEII